MGRRLREVGGPLAGHFLVGRRTRALLVLVAAETLLALALAVASPGPAGLASRRSAEASRRSNRSLVSTLGLTDLALFPGASYTRHPSQADRFAPFSDHPAALEHSPAGSIVPSPPPRATEGRP